MPLRHAVAPPGLGLAVPTALLLAAAVAAPALASPGPAAAAPSSAVPAPVDRPFPGRVALEVDASDLARRVLHVRETVTAPAGPLVLLYPQWLPGNHSPTGPIDRVAGIRVEANGQPLAWRRDPANVYALRVTVPAGAPALHVEFDYLSPTSRAVGPPEISRDNLILDWNTVLFYPAGYFARQIPVAARLALPPEWSFATALETEGPVAATTAFQATDLETLIDSPVYAGRHAARFDLDPGGPARVTLNVFADRDEHLKVTPEQLDAHRALVRQAYRLFGARHYRHYDFLYSLSDDVQQKGLEHHQSSENGAPPTLFTDWDANAHERDLLAHEYTHSWNGKFRRPADLWTPNYNVPMQNSLLWVYEGQTMYWGEVLAARAGLRTREQTLDELALIAASYDHQPGRAWRPLQDTTNDAIVNYRRPMSWRDYQRYMDYYTEGALVWLDVDTLIRQKSNGTRSLDDFARQFFGINDGSRTVVTYEFADVVRALNAVQPFDWATFLRERLDGAGRPAPLDGITRGGYRLVYTDSPSAYEKARDASAKVQVLTYSLGAMINTKDGTLQSVSWGSPAFNAKLTEGAQVLAVNGIPYGPEILESALKAAAASHAPIELTVKTRDGYVTTPVACDGGPRYPHLERINADTPALLDAILAPRDH